MLVIVVNPPCQHRTIPEDRTTSVCQNLCPAVLCELSSIGMILINILEKGIAFFMRLCCFLLFLVVMLLECSSLLILPPSDHVSCTVSDVYPTLHHHQRTPLLCLIWGLQTWDPAKASPVCSNESIIIACKMEMEPQPTQYAPLCLKRWTNKVPSPGLVKFLY